MSHACAHAPATVFKLGLTAVMVAMCAAGATGAQQTAASGGAAASPCLVDSRHRQLDFWLGTWDVYSGRDKVGESRIERLSGSCSILETYRQPDGYAGRSLNFFDSVLGKWRQAWVDDLGTVSEFEGELDGSAMKLSGRTHTRDGRVILRKMVLSPNGANQVRQYSERSVDDGRTWSVAYDYAYKRRD